MRNRLLLPFVSLLVGLGGGYWLGGIEGRKSVIPGVTTPVNPPEPAQDSPAPRSAARADDATAAAAGATALPEPAAATQPEPRDDDVVRSWQRRERQMLRDPAYRESQRDALRQQLAQTRANAIRAVGMTPQQAQRVIELWVERNLWFQANGDMTGGGKMSPEQLAEMKSRNDAEQAEVRALLGEEKYTAWLQYLASGSERAEVNLMNAQAGSDALAATGIDALVVALHAERDRAMQEFRDYRLALGATDPFADMSTVDRQRYLEIERAANRRLHDAMASSLTHAQLERLDATLAKRLVPIEAALRLETGKGTNSK